MSRGFEKEVAPAMFSTFHMLHCAVTARVCMLGLGVLATTGLVANFGFAQSAGPSLPIQTSIDDYFLRGTQPMGAGVPSTFNPILSSSYCSSCHANYGPQDSFGMIEEYATWTASMMGQSARDPLFHAALTIANQDAVDAGTFCIRCHAPVAFLNGHHAPDGSQIEGTDLEGVNCNFCHRLVDPVYVAGTSPSQDQQILADLSTAGLMPPQGSNARYIIDPTDVRRGPFDDVPLNIHPGRPTPEILHSPFHSHAEVCWTCHDVSNPLMTKQGTTYALNTLKTAHPTGEQTQMLPLHRTYSEWKNSYYSNIGVDHTGRFGGNHPTGIMKACQDCHMPDVEGYGCNFEFDPFFVRADVPQHSFMGSNYWVLNAVRTVDFDNDGLPDFPDFESNLNDEVVAAAIERNIDFLQRASDLEVTRQGSNLKVRIINFTGHKLPTGFPDGRRMWISVQFLDCNDNLLQERGAYDYETATLTTSTTKVYEMDLGIQGAAYASSLGMPEGHTFHFMLANAILKDNRIPPAGHANPIAAQLQTQSVGAAYSNGQNFDDTLFAIPVNTKKAVVSVNYQITSKEFIEYLRDANLTDNKGQVVYNLWVDNGMSPPVTMDLAEITIYRTQDIDKDGDVDVNDLLAVIGAWGACNPVPTPCPADVTGDRVVNVNDLLAIISAWGSC